MLSSILQQPGLSQLSGETMYGWMDERNENHDQLMANNHQGELKHCLVLAYLHFSTDFLFRFKRMRMNVSFWCCFFSYFFRFYFRRIVSQFEAACNSRHICINTNPNFKMAFWIYEKGGRASNELFMLSQHRHLNCFILPFQ